MKSNKAILFFIATLFCVIGFAQNIKPFSTAQGGGAYNFDPNITYNLIVVDNMNDSGTGSLWSSISDNTIVVFKVSGIMDWNQNFHDDFRERHNCIVLAQTAPSGGVTIITNGTRFRNSTNLTFRYLRFRLWRGRALLHDPSSFDVLEVLDSNNIMIDHCSFAYGGDESVSTRGSTYNYTLQNSMITYGHAGSLMGDSNDHSLSYNHSSLGNFWHTLGKRSPNPNTNARYDNIGNVVYNLLNLSMRTGGNAQINEIGNYYRNAPRSHLDVNYTPLVFTANNRNGTTVTTNGDDNTQLWQSRAGQRALLPTDFTSTMFPLLNYTEPLPDGDDSYLRATNREMGANAYLDDSGNPVFQIDDLDVEAYDEFDNDQRFDWTDPTGLVSGDPTNKTQTNYRVIPQRQWLPDNEPNFGLVLNTHNPATHTGVVPNAWIIEKGLTPATFDPLGYDLDAQYPNILVYSFEIDGAISNNQPPIININGSTIVYLNVGDTYNESGATVNDNEDGDITANLVITGIQHGDIMNTSGTYAVYYNAVDNDNNPATQVTRTVVVSEPGSNNQKGLSKTHRLILMD